MLSEREWVGAATAKTGATGPNTIEATFQNHSEFLCYLVAIRISRITTEWHPHGFRIAINVARRIVPRNFLSVYPEGAGLRGT
jgi:hypothetical protein